MTVYLISVYNSKQMVQSLKHTVCEGTDCVINYCIFVNGHVDFDY